MKMKIATILAAALAGAGGIGMATSAAAAVSDAGLTIYDQPSGSALYNHHDDTFTVRVRRPGGEWHDLYEFRVMVDLDDPQQASMAMFSMAGPVEVAVKKNNGDVRRVEIRPGGKAPKVRLVGNTAYFTLEKPANLSVEFDGDRLHNLHLFANPPEAAVPDTGSPDVVYFGPGLHVPPDGQNSFSVASGQTVYISGGAILQGQLDIRAVHDVRIIGYGILEQGKEGIAVLHSRNVSIDGPTIVNPRHYTVMCGQSTGLVIRNLKTFSAGGWTDGIDLMACSDVVIDGVFLRTSDDSIAVYADRWDYHGDARNYAVTNSTLWADVAHPINIGLHGNKDTPRVIENLAFRDIDILGHDEDDPNYQGALAISDGDDNLVRNVVFENIRVDSIEEGMLFNFRALFNDRYSLAPGRGIENVTVRNVRFRGGDVNRSVLAGYAADRGLRSIRFENVEVAGRPLKAGDIAVGAFVTDLRVAP